MAVEPFTRQSAVRVVLDAYGEIPRSVSPLDALVVSPGSRLRNFRGEPALGFAQLQLSRFGRRHPDAGLEVGRAGGGGRSFGLRGARLAMEHAARAGGPAALLAHRAGDLHRIVRQ